MTTSQLGDSRAFREFEHAGWESIPQQYHESFADLTTQAIGPLLDAVEARRGVHLLDIATGPGYVAAAGADRGTSVVAIDFSAAMIAEGRRRYPALEFREADAEELPFADSSFQAAVMNFGLLHLRNPEQALKEAQRVLRSGGRFGFTVWAKPQDAVGFGIVLRAVETHGDLKVPLPPGPPFFRFSEPEECAKALVAAGFASPKVVRISQVWRLRSVDTLFKNMQQSTVRTAGLLRAQRPEALDAIRKAIRDAAGAYRRGDGIELPMPAVLASAIKP